MPKNRGAGQFMTTAVYASIAVNDSEMERAMATLTIRNLDDGVKAQLRVEAARHGRSMEEEVRVILQNALAKTTSTTGFGSRIHQRFVSLGDKGLTLPDRTERPRAAKFPK
jgi:plasmid stability protein